MTLRVKKEKNVEHTHLDFLPNLLLTGGAYPQKSMNLSREGDREGLLCSADRIIEKFVRRISLKRRSLSLQSFTQGQMSRIRQFFSLQEFATKLCVTFKALLRYVTTLLNSDDALTLDNALTYWWFLTLYSIGKEILQFHAFYELAIGDRHLGRKVLKTDVRIMDKSFTTFLDLNEGVKASKTPLVPIGLAIAPVCHQLYHQLGFNTNIKNKTLTYVTGGYDRPQKKGILPSKQTIGELKLSLTCQAL